MSMSLRAPRTKTEHTNTDSPNTGSGMDFPASRPRKRNRARSLNGLGARSLQGKAAPRGQARKSAYECIEVAPKSIWIGGRRTSIRLEPEFWDALSHIAKRERSDASAVLLEIERIHGRSRFASKVRVAILGYFRP